MESSLSNLMKNILRNLGYFYRLDTIHDIYC